MHIIQGEQGDVAHTHHTHTHTHTYEHSHEHVHTDDVENHDHDHGEERCHRHEDGHCHNHEEGHCHNHEEGHSHSHHGEGHCHEGGCCKQSQDETVAVLTYMLEHNEHHAAELGAMAGELRRQGKTAAADMIDKGVLDFQTANMRLKVALSMLGE